MTERMETKATQRGREAVLAEDIPLGDGYANTLTKPELSEKGGGKETTHFAPFFVEEDVSRAEGRVPHPRQKDRVLRPRAPHCPEGQPNK